jgi:hypothetical protein
MFDEAGVKVRYVTCDIVAPEIFMNAELFDAIVFLNSNKTNK